MHGEVCIGDAINWDAALNQGLRNWWLALPGQQCGVISRDLARRSDGTLTNGTVPTGPRGNRGGYGCWQFDGTDDHIAITTIASTTTFTVSLWIWPEAGDSYGSVFSQGATSGLFYKTGGTGAGKILFFSGGDKVNNTVLPLNTWSHITCSILAGAMTWYYNGQPDGTGTSVASFTPSRLGDDPSSETFKGKLSSIRYQVGRALTASEALALYEEECKGLPSLLNWTRSPNHSPDQAVVGGAKVPWHLFLGMGA
jgi:hypothetical protein